MSERVDPPPSIDSDWFEVFPWNRNFETGHEAVDLQHKTLVKLLNRLAKTLVKNETIEVNTAFNALANYADLHFKEEESVWEQFFKDDIWLLNHRKNHEAFLPKMVEMKQNNPGKSFNKIIEEIIKFLFRWLAFHIIDNDKRMAIVVAAMKNGKSITAAKQLAEKKMSGSMKVLIETVLIMYDDLSARAIELLRERHARIKAETRLKEANKKLEKLSITDSLTGLYNRRYFDSVFQTEIRRAGRDRRALTYILMDVDYFKAFNDTYGHLKGDAALARIGVRLKEICRRPGDFAFRMGGEEFSILSTHLPDTDPARFGEIIRSAVENMNLPHNQSRASSFMTVSAGLVSKVPGPKDTIVDYIRVADNRLYTAKAMGRNRVVASG